MAQHTDFEQRIDLEEAQRFLTWLDPKAERFTFQTFADGGKDAHLAKVHHLQPDQLGPLVRLNGQGAGVFVTVNATDLQGRRKANMQRVRAVWLDLDGAPLGPVQACPLPPHVVIESSPERYHAYWRVEDGVTRSTNRSEAGSYTSMTRCRSRSRRSGSIS